MSYPSQTPHHKGFFSELMFLGIVFDNHRSNKLEKPTQLYFFSPSSLILFTIFLLHLCCTLSHSQPHHKPSRGLFLYFKTSWRVSINFWRLKVITWSSSFDILHKRKNRALHLKLISFARWRIRAASQLQKVVAVVYFINHSVWKWIHLCFKAKTFKSVIGLHVKLRTNLQQRCYHPF